ncbi:abortive infection family protein [Litorivita sp. NS0012-18]|uniref:abortive infection family protein n=1 Tax=Litorivita sp. NS0012-18 TaxID=3127655 RepID=UPI00310BA522
MVKLKNYQVDELREWFSPTPGYVLDFSNRTFKEFFEDHFETNIYAEAFTHRGTSKFNRFLAFVDHSPPHVVIELLELLWKKKNVERDHDLEILEHHYHSDAWTVSRDQYNQAVANTEREDAPLSKLIASLATLPSHTAAPHLKRVSAEWTLDTVESEFSRAFDNIENDPEAAVTAACSMLESVFKSIIKARGLDLPKSMEIKALYRVAREPLGLSPDIGIKDTQIEADVRDILSALGNAIKGIGALRTHAGTAHGRERGFRRLDPRIARLSVNSASSIALFMVETWEKKFPEDKLRAEPQ